MKWYEMHSEFVIDSIRGEEKVLKEEMFKEVATEGIKREVIVKEESSYASTQTPPQKGMGRSGKQKEENASLPTQAH